MSKKSLSQATTFCSEAEYLPNSAFDAAQLCSSIRRSQRLLEKSLTSESKREETSMNFRFNDHGKSKKSVESVPKGTYQISVSKRKYYVGKSPSPQLFDKLDENINFLIQQQMQKRDFSDSLNSSQPSRKATPKRRTTSSRNTLKEKCYQKLESTVGIGRPRQVRKPRGRTQSQKNAGQLLTSKPKNVKKPMQRDLKDILEEGHENIPFTFTPVEQAAVSWNMGSGATTRNSLVYSRPKNVNKPMTRSLKKLQEQGDVPSTFITVDQEAINWKMDSATTSRNSTNLNMTATCSNNQIMPTNSFVILPMANYYNPPVGDKTTNTTGLNNNATSIQNTVYTQHSDIAGTAAGKFINSNMTATFKTNAMVPLSSCVLPPIERYYNPPIEEKPMSAAGVISNPSLQPSVYPPIHFDGPTTARKSVNSNRITLENVPMKPYHDPPMEEKPTLAAGVINNPSMLPTAYPPHFMYQLPTTSAGGIVGNQQFSVQKQQSAEVSDAFHESQAPIIDDFDMDLSLSPPMSDSWNEIFEGKNLREVLNIEPIQYRLTEEQLAAVALIMNVELARLRGVMNLVQKLPQSDITKMAAEINGNTAEQLSNDVNSLLQRYETSSSPSLFNSQHKNLILTD